LDLVTIELPPLRSRRDDIPGFLAHFVAQARERHPTSTATGFSREATARLFDHPWPGNVRELAHVVERCALLADGPQTAAADLPGHSGAARAAEPLPFRGEVLAMRELQRHYARWAFDQLGGHKTRTAEKLGIDIKTLNRWLASDEND